MFGVFKRNPVSVVFAVLLHGLILFFLLYGVDWNTQPKPATPKVNVVQAHTVDAKELKQPKAKERETEQQQRVKREQEKKRLAEKKKRKALEQMRISEQKAEQRKREIEIKRKAELKREAEAKRKAEAKRHEQAKREAEAKRKAEQQRKAEAKRKANAEAKRKAEAERKSDEIRRRAVAAQAERERALQEQLASEQNSREIDRYVAVIRQQIERSWLKPAQNTKQLSCVVQVRLIPGGDVIPGGVSIIRSSGNAAFDRSVETAVYKAAPLPVPSGSLFESFRTLKLNFKPNK